jgi:serine protease Do
MQHPKVLFSRGVISQRRSFTVAALYERRGSGGRPSTFARGPEQRRTGRPPLQLCSSPTYDFVYSRVEGFAAALLVCAVFLFSAGESRGQTPNSSRRAPNSSTLKATSPSGALHQVDSELVELTARVSPVVVQVLARGYGPVSTGTRTEAVVITRQRTIGSGVIVDPSGYIVTNAHVVRGAQRVQVILTKAAPSPGPPLPPAPEQTVLAANVVGIADDFDIALLKADAKELPTLPFADFRHVTQGQVVLAVGSPEGLENSVTMGVISSVARQLEPDSPIVFVQTDAPINPGNSGGALVDAEGRLVGINTFILSRAGGSEGLGFAIPAPIVKFAYQSLRQKGHVDRRTIGVRTQSITPTLAMGLGLERVRGIIVSDVAPGGPADEAGMRIGDVILEADGRAIRSLPALEANIYMHGVEEPLSVAVLRGNAKMVLRVNVVEVKHQTDSLIDQADPEKNFVGQLGVIAATITPNLASLLGDLRISSGVVVIARTADPSAAEADLSPGDIIHSVNGRPIRDIDSLRETLAAFKPGDAIVLQVERHGELGFVSFEKD